MPRWRELTYEAFMALLALLVLISLARPDDPGVELLNVIVWAVFLVDYGVRFLRAADRRAFVRAHVPELIAIIPLDLIVDYDPGRLLRLFRWFRLVRLVRAGAVFYRVGKDAKTILGRGGAAYVLAFTSGLVVLGGFAVWLLEPGVGSIGDAVWWAIVTVTTVGYGDFAPQTMWGRVVAVGLMVVGISTLAALTGIVATHVMRGERSQNPHLQHVWEYLQQWDDLPPAERKRVAALLTTLAEQDDSGGKTVRPAPVEGRNTGQSLRGARADQKGHNPSLRGGQP
jgi:voltage-gated potassium channel